MARMGERTGAGRVLAGGNLRVKRPLGRPRRKREAGLSMHLQELGGERGLDSSGSGLGRGAGSCEHGDVRFDAIQRNFLTR